MAGDNRHRRISELELVELLTGDEYITIVQGGKNKRTRLRFVRSNAHRHFQSFTPPDPKMAAKGDLWTDLRNADEFSLVGVHVKVFDITFDKTFTGFPIRVTDITFDNTFFVLPQEMLFWIQTTSPPIINILDLIKSFDYTFDYAFDKTMVIPE